MQWTYRAWHSSMKHRIHRKARKVWIDHIRKPLQCLDMTLWSLQGLVIIPCCDCSEYLFHPHLPRKILQMLYDPDHELPLEGLPNMPSLIHSPFTFIHPTEAYCLPFHVPGTTLDIEYRALNKSKSWPLPSWSLCSYGGKGERIKWTNLFITRCLISTKLLKEK